MRCLAIVLVVLGCGLNLVSSVTGARAQSGFEGEAGPQVPLPSIVSRQKARSGAPVTNQTRSNPEVPARKPRKPLVRTQAASDKKDPITTPAAASSRSERDRKLCLALQACRNEFIRCKAKIKHPDQSEAWSIAKEECGEHYKACVQKDFKSGEWFFTRWFYFQELDCR